MVHIRPLTAIRYARRPELDGSALIAPPYDVLDEAGKKALQARHPNNIVTIDLPHLPPKTVGPDSVYEQAAITMQAWMSAGIMARDARAAFYPYTQTYEHHGRTFHRRGFFALVRLSPFGAGSVVPHEKTYAAPIEDRLKLMRATGAQLSPIFGLYSDPRTQVTALLYERLGRAMFSGTLDGVKNDLWMQVDSEVENKVIDLMAARPIYIADGHHRYTTALQYQADTVRANGGPLPESHPANYCLFVLVAMQDPGLIILPTHRLVGGLREFSAEALSPHFEVNEAPAADVVAYARDVLPRQPSHTFGLYDGQTRKLYEMRLKDAEILKALEPQRSEAWRKLDVAILQRYMFDEVLQPKFGGGAELTRGYTAYPEEIPAQVDGRKYQIAILLQSTPLHALEELGKHEELMPQKSTYFYPKLATGMVINPLG